MDSDKPSPTPRKPRFAPKAPTQRKTRAAAKKEKADDNDDAEAQKQLLQRFNQLGSLRQQRSKVENKAPVQPTFIHGTKQSVTTRGSDVLQDGGLKQNRELKFVDLDDNTKQSVSPLSAVGPSVIKESSGEDSGPKTKEYREPWNYAHTYYPTTLPWRKPYSGDPDVLDEAEFGEAAMKLEYDESSISPASELGFLNSDETSENVRLLFLQLPPSLPHVKRSATAKGKEIDDKSGAKGSATAGISQRSCSLEELPAGQMGKLLVYKSGAVKLKLGETLYDVSPGSDCSFAQDVVAFNTKEKECCFIGNLDKRAVITPDAEYLLNSVIDLG